jgi:A118 family predicted phage portal protein
MEEGGCRVINQAYKSSNSDTLGSKISLESVDEWAEIEPEAVITGIERPLFAYFRYPMSNNIDHDIPLGVSCYSRATDLIRQADFQWSRFLWEFEAGEMALHVDELAFAQDGEGKAVLPNKRLYRSLGVAGEIGKGNMFQEWAPTLREQSLLNGLEAILRKVEFACGLAYGTLSDVQHVDKTATEIKISKQRSASTILDAQKSLEKALNQLLYSMDVWATISNLAPRGTYEVNFEWDDSILVDKESQQAHDSRLVSQGIMSKAEFRMRNFGETEEMARQMLGLVEEERQPLFEMPREE